MSAPALKKGCKALLDEALAQVKSISADDAKALHGREDVVFVDLRDIRELEREGRIEGAFHAPRGMIEFWIDPDSPYFKPVFGEDKTYVFFCAAGLRSALTVKTVQDMGFDKAVNMDGGFGAWKAQAPSGCDGNRAV
ncbi:MAG: rhodanese-like domain-containing protein [Rhizobiaceae bacterium]